VICGSLGDGCSDCHDSSATLLSLGPSSPLTWFLSAGCSSAPDSQSQGPHLPPRPDHVWSHFQSPRPDEDFAYPFADTHAKVVEPRSSTPVLRGLWLALRVGLQPRTIRPAKKEACVRDGGRVRVIAPSDWLPHPGLTLVIRPV
jgi:hypothetical protein